MRSKPNARSVQTKTEELQARRNALSKQIGMLKAKGQDATSLLAEAGSIPDQVKNARDAACRHSARIAAMDARDSQPAARIGSDRNVGRRQRRGAQVGHAAHLRLSGKGSRRRRHAAGTRLRHCRQAIRLALCVSARPAGATAARARALHARRANARARLHRVLHAVHRQCRLPDRHDATAEVPRRHVLGYQRDGQGGEDSGRDVSDLDVRNIADQHGARGNSQ